MIKNRKTVLISLTITASLLIILSGCANKPATNTTPETTDTTTTTDTTVTETTSTAASYDPCILLTEEDVIKALNVPTAKNARHDTEANQIGQKICFYDADEDDMMSAQLSITNSADMKNVALSLESLFINEKTLLDSIQEINGIGDDAYYGGSGLKLGSGLHVLVKNKGVKFTVSVGLGFGNDDDKTHIRIEKELAEKIIARL